MTPRRTLADWLAGRDNNFNLLRAIAASLVIYSHSFPFTRGFDARGLGRYDGDFLYDFSGVESGKFAVQVFFVVSGFLVAQSWEHSRSWRRFAVARFLRIFPGLAVCVLGLALVLGPIFTTLPLGEYLRHSQVWRFIAVDMTLARVRLEYCLPGVFETNLYRCALNVPHWTLPWEVLMYVALGVFGTLGLLARRWFMLAATVTTLVVFRLAVDVRQIADWRLLYPLSFGCFFFFGTLLWLFRDRLRLDGWLLAIAFAALVIDMGTLQQHWLSRALYIPILAYTVIGLALVPGGFIRQYNRLGDYSYGIYIYGFAVQQAIIALYPGLSATPLTLSSLAAVLLFAVPSWHLLEKRVLALKNRAGAGEPGRRQDAPIQ
jgi:peptidoglycan/LPS O-acetylase OafA/YrhL